MQFFYEKLFYRGETVNLCIWSLEGPADSAAIDTWTERPNSGHQTCNVHFIYDRDGGSYITPPEI